MSMLLGLLAAGATVQATAPVPAVPAAKPPFKLGRDTNLVIHANSYYAQWTYPGIQEVGELGALIRESGVTASNFAIPGTTWAVMTLSNQNVISAFDPAKTNILVCGETRNQTFEFGSVITDPQVLVQRTRAYITRIQAETKAKYGKGWDYVVLCGTIATQDVHNYPSEQVLAGNNAMAAYDEFMRDRANLASVGADYFVDYRTLDAATFDGDGVNRLAGFMASPGVTVMERTAGTFVHPIGAAREAFAACIARTLRKVADAAS